MKRMGIPGRDCVAVLLLLTSILGWTGCSIRITSSDSSSSTTRAFSLGPSHYGPAKLVLRTEGDSASGHWESDLPTEPVKGEARVQIELRQESSSRFVGQRQIANFPLAAKTGIRSVAFTIETEAGVLNFNGAAEGAKASGTYDSVSNNEYLEAASQLLEGKLSEEHWLELGLASVSIDYLKGVNEAGLKPGFREIIRLKNHGLQVETIKQYVALGFTTDELIRLRNFGVTPEFARDVRKLGYGGTVAELTKFRNFGLTPEYIQGWKNADFQLTGDELIKMRNFGITSESASAWKEAGYTPSPEELIKLKNFNVTPDYATAWSGAGYKLSYEELIKAKNFGVPREFAAQLKDGEARPSLEEIIKLRSYGVTPEFYTAMKLARSSFTTDDLLKLRQAGVTPEYVDSLSKAGYEFATAEIIRLRNSGVPADYAAALNLPGRKSLDAQSIIELRNRGVSAETARKLRE